MVQPVSGDRCSKEQSDPFCGLQLICVRDNCWKIVDLIRGDRRSPEDCESSVGEGRLVRPTARPVFARHVVVVSGGSAPGQAVSLIIGTHAVEAIAASQLSLKVINGG